MPNKNPNILFIFADQWRAQAFGFAGDPNVKTPNIDRFAGEAINFDNAVSEYLKVGYLYPKSRYWAMRARLRTAQIFEAQERWLDARKVYEEIALEDVQEAKHARERLRWMDKHKEELK